MIGDDDFFMPNTDYHSGASDVEKMHGQKYGDYNRNLWRDGILMKPPTLEEQKRNEKNEDVAALAFMIMGVGGGAVTLIFCLLISVCPDDYTGYLFFGFIILVIIFIILYRDNNSMIDKIHDEYLLKILF